MKVIKRNGKSEEVRFDLITDRIKTLLQPDLNIDPIPIAQKVTSRLRDNMTTRQLDDLSSQICMNLSEKNRICFHEITQRPTLKKIVR